MTADQSSPSVTAARARVSICNRCPQDDPFCIDCYEDERRELADALDAAVAREQQLREALRTMVDWHERGDMDDNAEVNRWFKNDLNRARAALRPAPEQP
jgi:hypothetical protein